MEKKIGKRTFRADKMVATTAVLYMFRIGKIAAPLLSGLRGVNLASLVGPDGNDTKTLEVIAGFFAQLDPKEGLQLVTELCEMAEVQSVQGNYESVIFDSTFSDNVMDAFQVAAMVVQVNFADFIEGKLAAK